MSYKVARSDGRKLTPHAILESIRRVNPSQGCLGTRIKVCFVHCHPPRVRARKAEDEWTKNGRWLETTSSRYFKYTK